MPHICNPSTWQVDTEEPRIQDNSQLCSEFKASPQNSFPLLQVFGINPVS